MCNPSQHLVASLLLVTALRTTLRMRVGCLSVLAPKKSHRLFQPLSPPTWRHVGYTALHMAAGYLHVPVVVALLEAGANPEVKDRKGQSVLELAESLKAPMAADPPRRFALEKIAEILVGAKGLGLRLRNQ